MNWAYILNPLECKLEIIHLLLKHLVFLLKDILLVFNFIDPVEELFILDNFLSHVLKQSVLLWLKEILILVIKVAKGLVLSKIVN